MKRYVISSNHFSIEHDEIHTAEDTDSYELAKSNQEYDSAKTSINSKKLPAIYNQVSFHPGDVVVDFGGGKFDNAVEYLKDKDVTLCVYDPYNRSDEHNTEVLQILRDNGGADAAVNSNVLNVIKEPEARKDVLENIAKITKSGAPVYIMVYEGTGKGNEGPTKSGYQLNRKTEGYMDEIHEVFPDAKRKGKLVVAHNTSGISGSFDINSSVNFDEVGQEIFEDIWGALENILKGPEYGFSDSEWKDYVFVDFDTSSPEYYHIEIRTELGYDDMIDLASELDSVVEEFDDDSYFDQVDPGIMEAYIDKERARQEVSSIESCNYSNIESAVEEVPDDRYLEAPEEPDYRDGNIIEYIDIDFNQIIYVNKNGNIEWQDPEYHFVDPSENNGTGEDDEWMSDDLPNCKIDDSLGVLEKIEYLISLNLPLDEGDYRIAGDAVLAYDIEYTYTWDNYEEDEIVYDDSYNVTYNFKSSELRDFRYKKLNS